MRVITSTKMLSLLALAAMLVCLFPQPSFAATGKIATINIQSILKDSAAAKSTKKQIDSKRTQYQNELKKIEDKKGIRGRMRACALNDSYREKALELLT